ncbi:hypothetical protein FNL55_21385 [Tardiphaga sp. vice352]|uniref:hypothetical protein n=1 Tax=unclassified Tardiphaga TaxID=2631404 RepID=UPI00116254EE|nr:MULTISPECIES: hypothetical protein [unclassified Tardiphaga]QDM18284.1 hypothetical protein FNL53_21900 [Tardiphaga sp. vice278]QDM23289.1 hypothetical protein FIU28_20700 [Tardiphaga sp. vice154]QDM28509.1 hypothetical protein FNL56_22135 [Tardiphaga sp. vice304]QDM33608.1 hypothetical protein FNL55_21385 [Tardiphaga sp. vice352]
MRLATFTAHRKPRLASAALLLVTALGLGGCANVANTSSASGPSAAFAQAPGGATVAFESIDGPPPQVFDRLVNLLDSEARLRNIAVVSRQDSAAYRVRSYLAAQIRGGKTSIAWVWDVYDRDQQRALRLTGEEPTGRGGADAWATADDLVLRRIAQAGLTGLGGIINGTTPIAPEPSAAPARGNGPAMANATGSEPAATQMALGFSDD